MIFKIVRRGEWAMACRDGTYAGSTDDIRDGYLHFSTATQVRATAEKYYKGLDDLVLVAFDEASLGPALRWEPARDGALFPHLYAPLPTGLALWEKALPLAPDGVPAIPEDIA